MFCNIFLFVLLMKVIWFMVFVFKSVTATNQCDVPVNYVPITKCPPDDTTSLTVVPFVSRYQQCIALCSQTRNCSVVTFIKPHCIMGNRIHYQFKWTNGINNCETHVKKESEKPINFLLFLDFRVDLLNKINSAKFSANPSTGSVRNSSGLFLTGSNYVDVNTTDSSADPTFPYLMNNLPLTAKFTFFAKVDEDVDSDLGGFHLTFPCGGGSIASYWQRSGFNKFVIHHIGNTADGVKDKGAEFTVPSMSPGHLNYGVGISFNGAEFINPYFSQGQVTGISQTPTIDGDILKTCRLRLGRYLGDMFRGRFLCYVIAMEMLNNDQFADLNNYCI